MDEIGNRDEIGTDTFFNTYVEKKVSVPISMFL